MKPDWNDAPDWAKYLACDRNGEWWWFEFKPHCDEGISWQRKRGKCMEASVWLSEEVVEDSLERRP